MTVLADSFGLHWDGPVAWLVQGRKGNNFVGLRQQCPVSVKGGMCIHLTPAAAPIPDRIHLELFMNIFPDPLVQAMLPIPHPAGENVFLLEDPSGELSHHIATLSRLSSPIKSIIKPAWMMKIKDLEKQLSSSNIQPLILSQAGQKTQEIVDLAARMSSFFPRTVVITGDPEVVATSPIQRIKTDIQNYNLSDLMVLPMENIGAALLRRYARKEALDDPWESREDRRNRRIPERKG